MDEEPFDPRLRRNSVLVRDGDTVLLIIRGAPEAIESSCAELDQKVKDEIRDWTGWEGRRGHRVLAVGYKEINTNDTGGDFYARALAENDFIFSGIISFVELLYYRSKLSNSL